MAKIVSVHVTATPRTVEITRRRDNGTETVTVETRTASVEEQRDARRAGGRAAILMATTVEACQREGARAARKAVKTAMGAFDADSLLREMLAEVSG